jgi:thiol-disulfide isomerase/thioredoxin
MDTLLLIVLVLVGFFVIMRLMVWVSGKLKKGKKIPPFSGELGERIQKGDKLLLYFYTPSCGSCKTMTPVVEEMMDTKDNVYKINLTKDYNIGKIFGIMGTPATIVVNESKIDQYILGARSKQFLIELPI